MRGALLALAAVASVALPTALGADTPTTDNGGAMSRSWRDLNRSGVIGALGEKLGTVVEVEGTILSDDARHLKEDMGAVLINVTVVNGRKLTAAIILRWRSWSLGPPAPKPGEEVAVIGFETGGFDGFPPDVFQYTAAFATKGFGFFTEFVPVKRRR